ncbi:MAG: response regulator [Desulfobacterales bacterium]|nr:response regulator [Desulfobacterales bacterium]
MKPSYEELQNRVQKYEAIIEAIRKGDVDAVVLQNDVSLLKSQEFIEEVSKDLLRKDELLKGVADALMHLLKTEDSNDSHKSLKKALEILGIAVAVDRVYVIHIIASTSLDKLSVSEMYTWEVDDNLDDNTYIDIPVRWYEEFLKKQIIKGSIKNFPLGEKQILEKRNVTSTLMVPIIIDENIWGFMGFDDFQFEREWSNIESSLILAAAGSIGSAIVRWKVEKELIESNLKLKEANIAKAEFLANISHDLKTPLNGILGFTQILKRDQSLSLKQLEAIATIHNSAEHLLSMISDILDISRIEVDQMQLSFSKFDFHYFLENIAQTIKIQIKNKEVTFFSNFSMNLPKFILADEKRLTRILLNLLGNAIKFTKKGKIVFFVNNVLIKNNFHKIQFSILDTGIGIPIEMKDKIFSLNQIKDQRIKTEGTGLGLSICKMLVDLMGGKINFETKYGEGTTFLVEVELEAVDAVEHYDVNSDINGKDYKILIVDDNENNRNVLKNMISPYGFEINEAVDGIDAVAKTKYWGPSLILMDILMPQMNGFESVFNIRNKLEMKDIPIIAVSASTTDEIIKKVKFYKFNDFISKPINEWELLRKLKLALKLGDIKPDEKIQKIITLPDKKDLEFLLNMVLEGDIKGIIDKIFILKNNNENLTNFCEHILNLSKEFKTYQIEKFIENSLNS